VPILIARLAFDEERERFSANVDQLLLAVEQAYWDLYFSYWNLYTQDLGLRQAHEAWQVAKQLADKKLVTVQDLAALEFQYQSFRLARLDALGGPGQSVLETERRLRFAVGLPVEDGCRLIPTDMPSTVPFCPDWHASMMEALQSRPDLAVVRHEIKKVEQELKRAKDSARPDLRAFATYDINGAGDRLDGAGADNALRSFASDHFNDWTIGVLLDVPIGFRAAHAQIRRAELLLGQRMTQLHDQEKQVGFALQQSYRELVRAGEVVRIQQAIRKAATERYQALYEQFRAGLEGPGFLLIAQQNWTAAAAAERSSVFAYAIALAKFELEKGTIQKYDNVSIADGPLPACAEARASAHIAQREHAHILRERASACPPCDTPVEGPPSIPDLLQKHGFNPTDNPVGPAPLETLPTPKKL
jgi:outer membrane protein TolC